jgi:hypothetical protein
MTHEHKGKAYEIRSLFGGWREVSEQEAEEWLRTMFAGATQPGAWESISNRIRLKRVKEARK